MTISATSQSVLTALRDALTDALGGAASSTAPAQTNLQAAAIAAAHAYSASYAQLGPFYTQSAAASSMLTQALIAAATAAGLPQSDPRVIAATYAAARAFVPAVIYTPENVAANIRSHASSATPVLVSTPTPAGYVWVAGV